MSEGWIPSVGDKVYHRGLGEEGVVTMTGKEYAGSNDSTLVLFGHEEKEVSTHLLTRLS